MIKSRAAVAFAAGEPLQIVELDVEPPKAGEVLIKIAILVYAIRMLLLYLVMIQKVFFQLYWDMKVQVSLCRSVKV